MSMSRCIGRFVARPGGTDLTKILQTRYRDFICLYCRRFGLCIDHGSQSRADNYIISPNRDAMHRRPSSKGYVIVPSAGHRRVEV